jgi:hypothetical protein
MKEEIAVQISDIMAESAHDLFVYNSEMSQNKVK